MTKGGRRDGRNEKWGSKHSKSSREFAETQVNLTSVLVKGQAMGLCREAGRATRHCGTFADLHATHTAGVSLAYTNCRYGHHEKAD